MPFKLISWTPFPPGAFPYEQTVKGVVYKWPDVGLDLASQAQKIASFRKANNLPRASLDEVVSDLSEYTCQRLGFDSRWCSDGSTPTQAIQHVERRGCATCGAKL